MTKMNRREFGRSGLAVLAGFALPQRPADRGASDTAYRYIHLDVFTDQRLAGNQLLVYIQPAGLSTEAMQALTRESNYSENTFVLPPNSRGPIIASAFSREPRKRRLRATRPSAPRSRSRMRR